MTSKATKSFTLLDHSTGGIIPTQQANRLLPVDVALHCLYMLNNFFGKIYFLPLSFIRFGRLESISPVVESISPVVERIHPIVEKNSPVVEKITPVVERNSPVVEKSSPAQFYKIN